MKLQTWLLGLLGAGAAWAAPAERPNIVFILCDDLGYGDVRCLNPAGKIATPQMDRLAAGGMKFTDAHSGSAVCTPTRYGVLTGRYAWRTRLQSGVLLGYNPPLIAADRLTVPALLKQHGYHTAGLGKWHLGLTVSRDPKDTAVRDGPTTRGFDYFFGISASLDMPPFAFIENDHFTQAPTATKAWVRKGAAAPDFEAVDVLPTLTRKAEEYLAQRAAAQGPFFLYLALTSPHTPIVPTKEWQGKSGLNAYGDFVMQTDATVGRVLDALEKNGLTTNTLVFFASDNGCSPAAGTAAMEKKGHFASGPYRGYKADIFDGGHRIPFIARWPGHIRAGSTSEQLVCLTDLLATCADLLGAKLPANAGEDSVSLLPALLGTATGPLQAAVVHHSINGSFALRQGRWKLEFCGDSGGWSAPKPRSAEARKLPPLQIYDLTADVGERRNVFQAHPDVVADLAKLMRAWIAAGRSTPGAARTNDVPVSLWKAKPPALDDEGRIITHD